MPDEVCGKVEDSRPVAERLKAKMSELMTIVEDARKEGTKVTIRGTKGLARTKVSFSHWDKVEIVLTPDQPKQFVIPVGI